MRLHDDASFLHCLCPWITIVSARGYVLLVNARRDDVARPAAHKELELLACRDDAFDRVCHVLSGSERWFVVHEAEQPVSFETKKRKLSIVMGVLILTKFCTC